MTPERRHWIAPFLLVVLALFLAAPLSAQEAESEGSSEKEEENSGKDEEEKDAPRKLSEVLKDCETTEGLFRIHQDRKKGTLYLEIRSDQIAGDDGKPEFIHFSHTLDGVPQLGFFRGQFGDERIFTIRRHFERLEFVAENTAYFFRADSALSRAAGANRSDAVLASAEIAAEDEESGRVLVKADDIFLKEFFRQLKSGKKKDDKEDKFTLGDLSDDRTRFLEAKSFPDNTLFRVRYVFQNLHPAEEGEADVADSRFVSLKIQHTFLPVPENDYEPRFDDPRVGYFTTQVTDLTSKSSAPYRDFVHRWHLKKQDPEAESSDPVEPLVWWIENTTPEELRDTIRDGVLAWNLAFESAGITNAIEVRVQPDDAEWDADDIRYHVLRWTSSPDPPFGGYGPSFANPRTGQILGADIMLEYIFLTNRIRYREIVNLGAAAPDRFPFSLRNGGHLCTYGSCLHDSRIAAGAILRARAARFGNGPVDMEPLIRQALTDLILHEVGHTLGLNHNFRASHLYDREQIHDTELTAKTGLTGSVMEYSPINLARDPEKQGHYFSLVPGPYDHWAIRFGYADSDELDAILAESTRPEHVFANDADDMRSTGRGIDPRAMISDLTNEPIANAADRMAMVEETLVDLADQFPVEGESYHELRTAFSTLVREFERAATTCSRFIGGVEVERAFHGQEGAPPAPLRPVDAATQREAMRTLAEHVFAPKALSLPPKLVARLQLQRRGFEFFELEDNEDPKIHQRLFEIRDGVLDQILHPHTLERVIDSSLYGNDYTIDSVMNDLDAAIMEVDPDSGPDTLREELQLDYIERLIDIAGLDSDSKYPAAAQSRAVYLLENHLRNFQDRARPMAAPQRAHLTRLIDNALSGR